jgi:amino acid transporter
MAFNVSLAAQVAGPAAPLAFAIGTAAMLIVGLSFVIWSRRMAHAGSAYGFITHAFGKRWGFMAGWALLLTYLTYGAGTSALVGNFIEAAARTCGFKMPGLWVGVSIAAILLATFLARRDMRIAGRTMLVLEGLSLLALVTLAVLILVKVSASHPLSLRPFAPSRTHNGWAGVGYALVFAVLSFGGFEAAATLGEETNNPRRNIPIALLGTLLLAGVLYVLICYTQVIGYGLENTAALANDSAPLDTLAVRYASRGYAVVLDLAAALGGFSCVLGCLSAAGRMLYALGRAGLSPAFGRTHPKRGTPANAILIVGAVCLFCLLVWAQKAGPGAYYGAMGTVGTLALILVYLGVAWAQARNAGKQQRGLGSLLGLVGVLLLLWPLYNSVYPVPAYPGDLWPFLLLIWLACGALLLWARPALAREELPEIL